MIAAAMATPNPRRYIELAKAGTTIERSIPAGDLVRLGQATVAIGETKATFVFTQSEHGKPEVSARVEAEVSLACQWCLEPKPSALVCEYRAVLATDEAQASDWSVELEGQDGDRENRHLDVLVAGSEFDAIQLVEDELLLALPHQVCGDEGCPDRPQGEYGEYDASEKIDDAPAGPFAALASLKKT